MFLEEPFDHRLQLSLLILVHIENLPNLQVFEIKVVSFVEVQLIGISPIGNGLQSLKVLLLKSYVMWSIVDRSYLFLIFIYRSFYLVNRESPNSLCFIVYVLPVIGEVNASVLCFRSPYLFAPLHI